MNKIALWINLVELPWWPCQDKATLKPKSAHNLNFQDTFYPAVMVEFLSNLKQSWMFSCPEHTYVSLWRYTPPLLSLGSHLKHQVWWLIGGRLCQLNFGVFQEMKNPRDRERGRDGNLSTLVCWFSTDMALMGWNVENNALFYSTSSPPSFKTPWKGFCVQERYVDTD